MLMRSAAATGVIAPAKDVWSLLHGFTLGAAIFIF